MAEQNNISPPSLIDSHCHIDFAEFDADRVDVIRRASQLGVSDIIVPSVTAETWSRTLTICQQQPSCHLCLGLHPVFIAEHQPQHLSELSEMVDQHKPIAIGEIGLDFYAKELARDKQLRYFDKQLIIAKRKGLPVIIHNRKAHDECIELLTEHRVVGGIIHAFNGSIQQAQNYIDLGFCLGFGGMLTFPRSRKLRNLAKALPLHSMVLETDAPDMTVAQHRGKRNSPEYLPMIMQVLADIKGVSHIEIAQQTNANVRRIFPV